MKIILTMAGKYSRFTNAGINIPKYLLPWGKHTILTEIIELLTVKSPGYYNLGDHRPYTASDIYLVANGSDSLYLPHVAQTMKACGIPNKNLLITEFDTTGQCETAYYGITRAGIDGSPVIIMNIDTILKDRSIRRMHDWLAGGVCAYLCDGYIDVFRSNNQDYSYVLLKDDEVSLPRKKECFVAGVHEKVVVSELATSGMYGFSSDKLFCDMYSGQIYITEMYEQIIKSGKNVVCGPLLPGDSTIVLGTPEEYFAMSAKIV
jgi:hypothetical protein